MCGFVGFCDDSKNKKKIIRDMADIIKHRGPDSDGYYVDNNIALGFRRLSIIDLDKGSQPIFNEDKDKVIVFNGEIYNYKEIREELKSKGHKFSTNTDTEVILHGYEEYKEDILNKLRGMFAFVIYDIKEKSLQIKEFYSYYQVSNGENLYLEYAFGADNMTDFIYRMSIVEQMTEYNKEVIKSLNDMISKNEKREVEIKKKQKDLAKKKESLNDKVKSLGEDVASLEEGGVDSEKQLKIYQEIVASYKKLGCKSKDVIGVDCAVNGPAGKFRRPTAKGTLSSGFGWRWGSFHRGVDITSSNRRREKIYPVANGTITSKYHDNYGALVIIMEHYDSDSRTWYSSLYAHLSSYAPNISTGQYITSDRYIGYMGNTGYVIPRPTASNPDAGTHLHLEVAPCRIYKDNKCGSWNTYVSFMKRSASKGYKGPKQLINLPSSWNSR
jgi:murein DD-endopeptidase MepM/ murein hydrolase activator NlpD